MDLQRRKNWQEDKSLPEVILEITTCITCPDSDGFKFENEEIIIETPICKWGKEIPLSSFPIIPYWCPKLDVVEPDMIVTALCPEHFYHKELCWKNLSQEAKMVLGVLFELPEEFISKQKQWIISLISKTIRECFSWGQRTRMTNKIYKELKEFTYNLTTWN